MQLGYESRCAPPHAFDVMLGSQLGIGAYRALVEEGLDGHMVSVAGQLDLRYVPFRELGEPARRSKTEVRFIRSRQRLSTAWPASSETTHRPIARLEPGSPHGALSAGSALRGLRQRLRRRAPSLGSALTAHRLMALSSAAEGGRRARQRKRPGRPAGLGGDRSRRGGRRTDAGQAHAREGARSQQPARSRNARRPAGGENGDRDGALEGAQPGASAGSLAAKPVRGAGRVCRATCKTNCR